MLRYSIILPLFAAISSPAMAQMPTYESSAPIAYLMDMSSGAILFKRDENRQIPPASMAKMMTVYVAFDMIKKGEIKADDKFTMSDETWRKWNNQGSTMFLAAGSQISVRDLLHGIITLSGNDACVVLAEGIAGTEEAFAQLMTKKAKELGMTKSRFGNSNGWPDEGKTLVTAHDLAILAQRSIGDFPQLYKEYYGVDSYKWNGITQPNRNPLIGKVSGADGLKTGHTEEAGYGFTGSAVKNGRRLIMVVAGLDSYNGRIDRSVKLINWGFNAFTSEPLFKKGTVIGNAQVQNASVNNVALVAPDNLAVTIPKIADASKLTMAINYAGPVKAPFKKGDIIAHLQITGEGLTPYNIPLAAAESVDEAGIFGRIWAGFKSIFGA